MEFSTLNGYKVKDKKAIRFYDTVDDMKNDSALKEGMHVKTKGYYTSGDGGNGEYLIVNDSLLIEDNGLIHELTNGLKAKLINDDIINVKLYGAIGDGVTDDSIAIQNAINNNPLKTIFFPKGVYGVTDKIIIYQANNYGVNLKLDDNATIKNISGETLNSLIEVGLNTTYGNYSRRLENNVIYIEGGIIDCSNVTYGMIIDSGRQLVRLNHTVFTNIEDYGLFLSKNLSYTSGDVKVSYCDFFRADSNQGMAILVDSYDNELLHIRIDGCQVAIKVTGGYQTFDEIHCTALYNENSTVALNNATMGFWFTGGSASLVNCYADTYARGFAIQTNGRFFLTNCCVYYYDTFDTSGVTSAIDISKNNQGYISITNSKFSSAYYGDCAFIRYHNNSDYRHMINNNNLHLLNVHLTNNNNIVSYDDPGYCLQINDKKAITPYYSGKTFDVSSYYYLCSLTLGSTLNPPIIRIRNGTVLDATIKILNSTTMEVVDEYNSYWRTWTFALVKKRTITFSDNTTVDIYNLYVQIGNQALTSDVNTNIEIESPNCPIFSYRKLEPEAETIAVENILASQTIQKTTP